MEEELKKEIDNIFIKHSDKSSIEANNLCKDVKTYTQNILKAQNKELGERNNQLRMTILGVNINTGMIKGNELIIEENNKIINNL